MLAGLNFTEEMMDSDVGALSGGWKMRVALARILLMRPDAMLLDEPSNHLDLESLIWLEQFLRDYQGALLMTSHDREFMNRVVTKIVEIDGGALTTYAGDYEFYEQQRALNEKQQQAQFERQQAMLAKEIKFIERFKARASHAAQVQSRVKKLEKIEKVEPPRRRQIGVVRLPAGAALRRGRGDAERRAQGLRRPKNLRGAGLPGAPQGALVRHGRQRRRQVHAAETRGGRRAAGRRRRRHRRQRQDGLFRAARDGAAGRRAHACSSRWRIHSPRRDRVRCARWRAASAFRATTSRRNAGCFRAARRRGWSWRTCSIDPPNFLVLDEPTNHLDLATKEMLIEALSQYEGTMLFVSHDRHFLAALSNRVLELTPEGVHSYGGGYTEYVARTGQEAPGLRG